MKKQKTSSELPTAAPGTSQAPSAAVDNIDKPSAPKSKRNLGALCNELMWQEFEKGQRAKGLS